MLAVDCGIDIGSTNVKVVFVGEGGDVLWTFSQPSPRNHDGNGPVTNPFALVATLEDMIVQGWRELRLGQPIRSITTAGVGEDGCCVDASLQPLGYAIPWFDKRASAEAAMLAADKSFLSRTGNAVDETRTAAKWLWLRRHRPEELAHDAIWLCLTDFPIAWWAGRTFMSSSLAPRTTCFDVHDRSWIAELLSRCQAPQLPPVLNAGTVVGSVSSGRLRESGVASAETALVAGGHDHPIAASLIRRFDASARVDSLGTANLVYGETPVFEDVGLLSDLAFSVPPSAKGYACLGVLEFGAAVQSLSNAEGVRQFLSHQRLPGQPPSSADDVLQPSSDPQTLMRRTLESMSLKARHLLSMLDKAGVPQGQIYTTGGWSRSRAFVELRASVFGQPIVALGDIEMTALGAALFGAEATGGAALPPATLSKASIVDPLPHWAEAYQAIAAKSQ